MGVNVDVYALADVVAVSTSVSICVPITANLSPTSLDTIPKSFQCAADCLNSKSPSTTSWTRR